MYVELGDHLSGLVTMVAIIDDGAKQRFHGLIPKQNHVFFKLNALQSDHVVFLRPLKSGIEEKVI